MNNNLDDLKEEEKSGEMWNNSTVMALVFIVAGVVLITANITGFEFDNWWVIFMLIPIAIFANNIYSDYKANGRITASSTGSIIVILAMGAGAAVFLFEAITWGMIWPIGLIIAGLSMYLGSRS
ncbi:MAG: hypothetical protein IPJ90_02205 [Anaerolineaceae bacterium]|nr:hypothetical protein [Anaerolineaceae bacterium]